MQLGRIIGSVVATRKEESLTKFKLLVVEVLEPKKLKSTSECTVAIDTLGAGVGDTVLITTGSAARVLLPSPVPVDAAVVGIVDTVDVGDE
jgi:ethanolamine utilization protein EutN